jgi:Protein of unknown function (DUF3073)
MGRGRAKAKQTKVARELKYRTGGTDLDALSAELAGQPRPAATSPVDDELEDDPYAKYLDDEDDDR